MFARSSVGVAGAALLSLCSLGGCSWLVDFDGLVGRDADSATDGSVSADAAERVDGGDMSPDSGATDGSVRTDGSAGMDGSSAQDSATQGTPGKVSCGSNTCNLSSQKCCSSKSGGGQSCEAIGANCLGSAVTTCDEAADCAQGDQCCFAATGSYGDQRCQKSCGSLTVVCKTTADCAGCRTYNCAYGIVTRTCTHPGLGCN